MATTPEKLPSADALYDWARLRDPLRTRHGLSLAQYGSAFEIPDNCRRIRSNTSNRVLQLVAAFVLGATAAMLFC